MISSIRTGFIVLLIFISTSCNQKSENKNTSETNVSLNTFSWLKGTWEGGEARDQFYQSWHIINDSIISGENLIVVQNDTIFFHNITIEKKGNTIVYKTEPKWMYENPSSYRIKINNNGEHVFEDPQTEFPQRIIYLFNEDGSLYYRLEGQVGGQPAYEEYTLFKMY